MLFALLACTPGPGPHDVHDSVDSGEPDFQDSFADTPTDTVPLDTDTEVRDTSGADSGADDTATIPLDAADAAAEISYLSGRFGGLLFGPLDADGDSAPDITGGDLRFFPVATRGEHELTTVQVSVIGLGGTCGGPGLTAMAPLGDVDEDGYDDLAWGAPCGPVGLLRGPVPLDTDYSNADGEVEIEHLSNGELGDELQPTADFDGNGLEDLAIGDPGEWTWGAGNGAVFFTDRRLHGWIMSSEAPLIVRSTTASNRLGDALASIDLDGDGIDELVAGAPGRASLAVLRAPLSGSLTLADIEEIGGDAGYGRELAACGDWDGDGLVDLAIGADAGVEVHAATGTWRVEDPVLSEASLSAAGDVDGDGVPDIAVGASAHGAGGGVWVFRGGGLGTVGLAAAIRSLSPEAPGDGLGAAILGLGDIDGDGLGDLAVGATPDIGGFVESRIYLVTTAGE